MLGNAMLRYFASMPDWSVRGTARTARAIEALPLAARSLVTPGVDVADVDSLLSVVGVVRPDIIINCIGLVKQLAEADDPLAAIPMNAVLPHRLARLAAAVGARFIHISTDCVFSGKTGAYREGDAPDAADLYGRSKLLGEVVNDTNTITLRTSIIGRELASSHGLVDWFLTQKGEIRGYSRAIFSGVPTVELARIVREFVIPDPSLHGLYHVSADPISKLELLRLVAEKFAHDQAIVPDERVVIDRSLNSDRFRAVTGYLPPVWPALVERMREFG